jgi:hypothetical protein
VDQRDVREPRLQVVGLAMWGVVPPSSGPYARESWPARQIEAAVGADPGGCFAVLDERGNGRIQKPRRRSDALEPSAGPAEKPPSSSTP